MNIADFISKFSAEFDDTDTSEFSAETKFKNLEEWSSITALSIIAMADNDYGIELTGEDIRNSETIKDLFDIINKK
ncbi:acyl carrier protein [Chryseobacterium taeanense]|uniref:acyl carrier protein n=1 Tax=Chryseobacterium taeanense TaxID=311334 RepID=UPI0035B3E78E